MTPTLIRSFLAALILASVGLPSTFAQSTYRVSVNSVGVEGSGASSSPSSSTDGRFIAFSSEANNLVAGDTNSSVDVFVHDRFTGNTKRVSVSSSGVEGNGDSGNPSISADGRFIAFESGATNLVSGVGWGQIYLHDRLVGGTYCVSVNSGGIPGNDRSGRPSISASGLLIAFDSDANNLVGSDTNHSLDVFLHDFLTGQTRCISVATGGGQPQGGGYPSLSADGRYCAFQGGIGYDPNDLNGMTDIFVHDGQNITTTLVSRRWDFHASGNRASFDATISGDGNLIAYFSDASDLVANDVNGQNDVFVWNQGRGQTMIASVNSTGSHGNWSSYYPSISANGRFVSFTSRANNLVSGDTNNADDIFVRDLALSQTVRASVNSLGVQANGGYFGTSFSSLSADGRFISFSSEATNLVSGDTNGAVDIFVHDAGTIDVSLAKTGSCPGTMTLDINNASLGGLLAILYGRSGSFTKSNPPCAGMALDLRSPVLAALIPADGYGSAKLNFSTPAGACGLSVQAVDVTSCVVTNVIVL